MNRILLLIATLLLASLVGRAEVPRWYLHDVGSQSGFHSIHAVGEHVVATTRSGQIWTYRERRWQPLEAWDRFRERNPFGTGSDRNRLQAVPTRDGVIWIGSFAMQANDIRLVDGEFLPLPRGTSARVISASSYAHTVLMGLNNGRVMIATETAKGTLFRFVKSLPGASPRSLVAVGGTGHGNVWASTGVAVFRGTHAGSREMVWAIEPLPEEVTLSVHGLSVTAHEGVYFGASGGGTGMLLRWQNGAFDPAPLYTFSGVEFFNITGLYARDAHHIWIIGDRGNLWFFDGTRAVQTELGTHAKLTGIASSDHGIWVVSNEGHIFSTVTP